VFFSSISVVAVCICCCIACGVYQHRKREQRGISATSKVNADEPECAVDTAPPNISEILHELRDEIQDQQQQEQNELQEEMPVAPQPSEYVEIANSKPVAVQSMSPVSNVLPMSPVAVSERKYKSRSESIKNAEYHQQIKDQVQNVRDRMDSNFKILKEVKSYHQQQLSNPPPSSLENGNSSYSDYNILREYAKLGHHVHVDKSELSDFDPNIDDDEKNTELSNHEHENIIKTRSSLTIPMGAMSQSNAPSISINDSDFHIIPEEYTVDKDVNQPIEVDIV